MSNKTLVCFYTEGATDLAFYNKLLEHLRGESSTGKYSADKVEKQNIKGIGNFQNKLLRKFQNEILPYKKEGYHITVFLCYDKDVFDFNKQPPVDRKKLEKDLRKAGADNVVHIVANRSIEDIFLTDEASIISYLHLKKKDLSSISGSGYERLKKLYRRANLVYYKGEKVEGFVEKLDMKRICCEHCKTFQPICEILFLDLVCSSR